MEKVGTFLKKHSIICVSIIIAVIVEILIFNYGFFRTILCGNVNEKIGYSLENNDIVISDINVRVTNITFKYKQKLTDKITYKVSYITYDDGVERKLDDKVILSGDKQYINLDTHSNCKNLSISYTTTNQVEIEDIIINHPTININILRIIIICCIAFFCLQMKYKKIYEIKYSEKSKFHDKVFRLNLIFFCAIIALYIIYQFGTENILIDKEDIDRDNSVLMQAEAIVNGQIQLQEEPSEELKSMENPYDGFEKDVNGVFYLYDVAYYNGHYYNYFGIAPILTSILPFRIITGKYLQCYVFNMIYVFAAVFVLYSLYKKIINKFFKNISLCNYYFGFYAVLFASNIFTLFRGEKYDIVTSSAVAFTLISINLAISAYSSTKHKILKLIILGITTGLIVLSKPNYIVYYILIFVIILKGIKKLSWKEKIKDILPFCIPLGLLAIFQMILNYVRFDNIFEFGAKYQLTGTNMIPCISVTFGKIYLGFFEYLFKTVSIKPFDFPFVFANKDTSGMTINEFCYENRLVGLINIPILYGYILKRSVIKKKENPELALGLNLIILSSMLSIIINTCCGGICEAYSVDFKLMLAIGAIIILLKWIEKNNNKADINTIFLALCISTILIMLPISLTTEREILSNLTRDITVCLKNTFEFWR